jgi:HAD superfamily hydrolase (TIGR01549 family)
LIDNGSIKVVAFDCDGVMFDSSQANRAYYNQVLTYLGLPEMTTKQFAYAHMHTVDETLAYLIRDQRMLSEAHRYRKKMNYLTFIQYMVVEPSLKTLLAKLTPTFKTAIATNRTDTMDRVLSDHGLEEQFNLVVTASDVRHPKPHPEELIVILNTFGIQPGQMVYIGDSELDAQAAISASVPFIAYQNKSLTAHAHIDSLRQVEDLLGL